MVEGDSIRLLFKILKCVFVLLQVANSCYSFTFYRSLSYEDAEAFCKVDFYLRLCKGKEEEKMLENRPEDALDSLVKTVETVETERKILKYLTL